MVPTLLRVLLLRAAEACKSCCSTSSSRAKQGEEQQWAPRVASEHWGWRVLPHHLSVPTNRCQGCQQGELWRLAYIYCRAETIKHKQRTTSALQQGSIAMKTSSAHELTPVFAAHSESPAEKCSPAPTDIQNMACAQHDITTAYTGTSPPLQQPFACMA